ncbi:MAG: tRNA (N(6)-L-threonylcarbamoyladenosine(37)-C(2))-methylthiotransferase MtaB [Clostridia bacterium]|nr:tRNA (N(6)-L-threonylcarbamoyladenosine(37)-C(2))-methylthiotransferase MtaB [Clostridia bacterium]
MNFSIITFGCKVNQCESDNIRFSMIKNGYELSENIQNSDIIIINSCTVTAESDRKLRQTINRIKKTNPSGIIVLTGCMPQAFPEKAKKLLGIDIVIGNSEKHEMVSVLKNYLRNKVKIFEINNINNVFKFEKATFDSRLQRSRAFLKIEDGCDRFCSYCIIPYARGRVRSKNLEEIKKDIFNLSANGYKEIVLVGINLFSYGKDINSDICEAVKVVAENPDIKRIRLGSLEPDLVSDEIIEKLSCEKKLCSQFHLSLQSGSDKILKSMRRRYTSEEYLKLIKKLRDEFPDATFTTDLMVGFPGETENDFEKSLEIIEKTEFLKVHVFPYSRRPGTLADKYLGQISKNVKTERVKKAIEFSEKISKMVLSKFIGKTLDVLFETKDENGFYEGYTSNYIYVKVKSDKDLIGNIERVELLKIDKNFCIGMLH